MIDIIECPEWRLDTPQKQVLSRKKFSPYEVILWVAGSRIPISLGIILLPASTNITQLVETLNADLQIPV